MDPTDARRPRTRTGPPDRVVSANDVVSMNLGSYRKATGLSQQQLADKIGWLKQVVSTAERSWEAKRTRNFTADDLVEIASALGLPVAALLLPPEDDGTSFRYVLENHLGEPLPLRDLLPAIFGPPDANALAAEAYRRRLTALGGSGGAYQDATETLERARSEGEEIVARAEREAASLTAEARKVLADAQLTADTRKALSESQAAVDDAIVAARSGGDEAIVRVRNDAVRILDQARHDADEVLTKARGQAEQITFNAAERANALERDAQERHRQAMGSLVTQREELERRVDDLRAFEREYRSRLLRLIESHYRDLWNEVNGVDPDALLQELRTRAEQHGTERFSVVLFGEDGTYQSFTSDDIEQAASSDGEESEEKASGEG